MVSLSDSENPISGKLLQFKNVTSKLEKLMGNCVFASINSIDACVLRQESHFLALRKERDIFFSLSMISLAIIHLENIL